MSACACRRPYYWNTYDDPAIQRVAMADHAPDGSKLVVV